MLLVTEDATIATSAIGDAAKRFNYSLPSENSTTNGASALSGMISQLPISTKESLIAFRNENANTYLSEALLFAETSGTTGAPLQIPRTRTDLINGFETTSKPTGRWSGAEKIGWPSFTRRS